MEEQFKIALSHAIGEFNNNRTSILKLAFESGDLNDVEMIEQEYDALRSAYFEILRRQLDKNNHLYVGLISAANTETERLRESIYQLNNINDIINLTTAVVNLVGRLLIMVAI
jgi:methionine synthase II (cobalamin-independent)